MYKKEIQVIDLTVVNQENRLELQLTEGLAIPQEVGVAFLPIGTIRFGLSKEAAIDVGKSLQEEGEKLPDPPKKSDLVIPKDAQRVAQEARNPDGTER